MSKKNLILGGLLIFLIILAYLYKGPLQTWKEKKDNKVNFFAGLNINSLDKISINKDGQPVVLEKIGEKWKVAETKDFYVKESVATNLIESLKDSQKSKFELVSSNAAKKSEFGTDDKGIIVQLFSSGNQDLEFIIGKLGVNYTNTYISQKDSDKTYSVKAGLYSVFSLEDWRDNTIFDSSQDDISKLRFQYPNSEFTVEKADDKWKGVLPYEFEVDKDKVGEILALMSKLSAVKIPEQNFAGTGLENNPIIIEATGDGIDNILMVGGEVKNNEEENYFYAKKGDSDNIYLITKEQRDELDKTINDLK